MANYTKGKRKAKAAKKGHRKISRRKSNAGVVKAARARWGKGKKKTSKKRKR